MGLWILEDSYLDHVPGTAPLADTGSTTQDGTFVYFILSDAVSHLKHSTGRDRDIILVPQPSDSPKDPLNWPLWRRDLMFFIFCSNSAVVGCWSFMLTPGYGVLAKDFNIVFPLFLID
jgi:hypothetical protein